MGLASKLAAAQAASAQGGAGAAPPSGPPPSYGGAPPVPQRDQSAYGGQQQGQQSYGAPSGPPPGQQQYGAPSGPPPGQQQYGAPSGPPPGSQPQQGGQQYGAPSGPPPGQSSYGAPPGQQPPQQQQQYGQPPQQPQQPQGGGGGTMDSRQVESILTSCVQEQKLQAFYPPGSLSQLAQKVAQSGAIEKICSQWSMPKELAADLLKLALFDIVLYVDDSGSMAFEQKGERIDDLKLILGRVAFAASLFDADGIQVRFMNSNVEGNNINSEAAALQLLQQVKFSGLTPLGTSLDRKILQPLLLGPAQQNRLQKPMLVIAITDGTPAGEDKNAIFNVIINANSTLARTRYGPDAVSFQFAQVGDDSKAQAFLAELDTHPTVGGLVDCTSNYEAEQAEMMRKSGMDLTPDLWIVKLLMGGIDSSYDEQDERH